MKPTMFKKSGKIDYWFWVIQQSTLQNSYNIIIQHICAGVTTVDSRPDFYLKKLYVLTIIVTLHQKMKTNEANNENSVRPGWLWGTCAIYRKKIWSSRCKRNFKLSQHKVTPVNFVSFLSVQDIHQKREESCWGIVAYVGKLAVFVCWVHGYTFS